MATARKSKTDRNRRTTSRPQASTSRTTSSKQKADEPQEFPISHAMLRHIYDGMIESRLWAQSESFKPVISEATAIPAALAVKATDIFAAPADGRTIYPIAHQETVVVAYNPATLRERLAKIRRKHHRGVALVLLSQSQFDSSSLLREEAQQKRLPIVWVVLSDRPFDPNAPVFEIDVDGHDAVAVFRVISESIRRARNGRGPVVIHAHGATTSLTADSPGDPLARLEAYLNAKGLSANDIHILRKE